MRTTDVTYTAPYKTNAIPILYKYKDAYQIPVWYLKIETSSTIVSYSWRIHNQARSPSGTVIPVRKETSTDSSIAYDKRRPIPVLYIVATQCRSK